MLETTRRERDLDSLAIMESLVKSNKNLKIERLQLQMKVSNDKFKLAEMDEENSTLKKNLMEIKEKLIIDLSNRVIPNGKIFPPFHC